MSEMTLFLSQLMGPVLFVIGLSFANKQSEYMKLMKSMAKNGDFMFFDGIVELSAGLAVVLTHNYWNTLPEILVSLLGWCMLIEGALVLLTSKPHLKKVLQFVSPGMLKGEALALLVIGAYLCYHGYLI